MGSGSAIFADAGRWGCGPAPLALRLPLLICGLVLGFFLGFALFSEAARAEESQIGGWFGQWLRGQELAAHQRLLDRIEQAGAVPTAFVSDGCSGGFSENWARLAEHSPYLRERHGAELPFEPCCVIHDRAYHDIAGASSALASYQARQHADQALRRCVEDVGQNRSDDLSGHYGVSEDQILATYTALAKIMYRAVRFGGGPCTGLPWRWGYGYLEC